MAAHARSVVAVLAYGMLMAVAPGGLYGAVLVAPFVVVLAVLAFHAAVPAVLVRRLVVGSGACYVLVWSGILFPVTGNALLFSFSLACGLGAWVLYGLTDGDQLRLTCLFQRCSACGSPMDLPVSSRGAGGADHSPSASPSQAKASSTCGATGAPLPSTSAEIGDAPPPATTCDRQRSRPSSADPD